MNIHYNLSKLEWWVVHLYKLRDELSHVSSSEAWKLECISTLIAFGELQLRNIRNEIIGEVERSHFSSLTKEN